MEMIDHSVFAGSTACPLRDSQDSYLRGAIAALGRFPELAFWDCHCAENKP